MSRSLRFAWLVLLVCLAGCALRVRTADGTRVHLDSPEYRQYAARVFRAQNEIATRIAFLVEDAQSEAERTRLSALEEQLLEACAGLNELAAEARDGRPPGRLRAWRAARQVPACEAETLAARAALPASAAGP